MYAIWDHPSRISRARLRLLQLMAGSHGVVSIAHLRAAGVDPALLAFWVAGGQMTPLGVRSFALPGSWPGWRRSLAAAVFETRGVVSGRAAARLHGVSGFGHDDVELLVDRACLMPGAVLVKPPSPPRRSELTAIDGLTVVTLPRLLADAASFHFTASERARLTAHVHPTRSPQMSNPTPLRPRDRYERHVPPASVTRALEQR